MSGPLKVTITLYVPIMHGDQEITELELVEPTFESRQQLDRVQGRGREIDPHDLRLHRAAAVGNPSTARPRLPAHFRAGG